MIFLKLKLLKIQLKVKALKIKLYWIFNHILYIYENLIFENEEFNLKLNIQVKKRILCVNFQRVYYSMIYFSINLNLL